MPSTDNPLLQWSRPTLLEYLRDQDIAFEEAIHPAVFTMAESAALDIDLAGQRCKNLLVRNKKGKQDFLVVTGPDAGIDLAALAQALGTGRLSLCPPARMQALLGVAPGALSPLALVADTAPQPVRLLMDESLRANPRFLFHPLVNTSTICLNGESLHKFLESTGHCAEYLSIPTTR
ncbi:prolyl-tRNA synthetase associated domain-containing protein [Delftia acidovorans]|uniref:prolyl-tRNA synthetase associated domain-containing protein n=1 Tax=Delftia acidovorans TaxID=80866 RepID=UPI003016ADCC